MPCRASSSSATSQPTEPSGTYARRPMTAGSRAVAKSRREVPSREAGPQRRGARLQTDRARALGDRADVPDRNAHTPQNTADRVPRVDIMHLMRNSDGAGRGRRNPAPRSPVPRRACMLQDSGCGRAARVCGDAPRAVGPSCGHFSSDAVTHKSAVGRSGAAGVRLVRGLARRRAPGRSRRWHGLVVRPDP